MSNENAPAMWRVKYAKGNGHGGGSGGDWVYYEAKDYERMEQDVLEALLNESCGDGHTSSRGRNPLSVILRRRQKPELDEDTYKWRRYRVIDVAYLSGDEWVSVAFGWTPPTVSIGERA